MREFDLKELWEEANEPAAAWYDRQRSELAATARRKNAGVLQRIRRLVQGELIFSAAVFAGAFWWWSELHPLPFVLLELSILLVMILGYRYYRHFSAAVAAVPTLDVVASTETYLRLLGNYKRRLIRLSLLLTPFALIVGFLAGFGLGTENDFSGLATAKFWLYAVPGLLVGAAAAYFFTVWYYRFFIGSKEKELEALLDRLRDDS